MFCCMAKRLPRAGVRRHERGEEALARRSAGERQQALHHSGRGLEPPSARLGMSMRAGMVAQAKGMGLKIAISCCHGSAGKGGLVARLGGDEFRPRSRCGHRRARDREEKQETSQC